MTLKTNPCEGPDGTTVTLANSDDFGGLAWDLVSINSQTCAYETTGAWHDTSAMQIASATAANAVQVGWTDTAATSFACRWYEKWTAWPSALQQNGFNVRGASGATSLARREMNTDGTFRIVMSGVSSLSATVLTTGTWFRFEAEGTAFNGSAGTLTCRVYTGDSTTVTETLNLTSQTSAATIDTIRFGKFNGVGTHDQMYDDIAANIGSSTPLGPALTLSPGWVSGWDVKFG
jgi:hypothetical protein